MNRIITESEALELFDNLIDDTNEPYRMGCIEFTPSRILKELDPVAYREDFLIYIEFSLMDSGIFVEGYTDEVFTQ